MVKFVRHLNLLVVEKLTQKLFAKRPSKSLIALRGSFALRVDTVTPSKNSVHRWIITCPTVRKCRRRFIQLPV